MKIALFVFLTFFDCEPVVGLPTLTVSVKGGGEFPVKGLLLHSDGQSETLKSFEARLEKIETKLDNITETLQPKPNSWAFTQKEFNQLRTDIRKVNEQLKRVYPDGYQGCFNHQSRILGNKIEVGIKASLAYCRNHCKGYKYVGLEYGSECWCGNQIHQNKKVDESECFQNCAGEPTRKCGGGWRISVYLV